MAEITKPMALDESLNTTESSPRNIADVLAQGIGNLVTVVSRISQQTVYDELDKLNDVNVTSPADNDVLKYNSTTQKWENGQGGGGSSCEELIAPVETSTTASQAYAIGEQFILNGVLYTATANISAGGTITIDGNCTASDSLTEQIHEEQFNVIGTMKSLLSYTSSSATYTFPNDGYCSVNATASNSQCRLRLVDAVGNNISSVKCVYNNADDRTAVFVRKGMQAYVDQQSGTVSVSYVPLISYSE